MSEHGHKYICVSALRNFAQNFDITNVFNVEHTCAMFAI